MTTCFMYYLTLSCITYFERKFDIAAIMSTFFYMVSPCHHSYSDHHIIHVATCMVTMPS